MSDAKKLIEIAKDLIPVMVPATHENRIGMFVALADGIQAQDLPIWAAAATAVVLQFPNEANRTSACAAAIEAAIQVGRELGAAHVAKDSSSGTSVVPDPADDSSWPGHYM